MRSEADSGGRQTDERDGFKHRQSEVSGGFQGPVVD